MSAAGKVLPLAWADWCAEARLSACAVLGLAAVLAPLLVLFGLKYGLVATLTERLLADPRTRELLPVGSGRYDGAWFERLRAQPQVGFVVPRTRQIAATAELRAVAGTAGSAAASAGTPADAAPGGSALEPASAAPAPGARPASGAGRPLTVELIPSAPGDALLARYALAAPAGTQVVLSQPAAEKLGLAAGASVEAFVVRTRSGREEAARVTLTISGLAPLAAFDRDGAFVALDLLEAAEDWRDGYGVPRLGWPGEARPGSGRVYPGFRLYARTLDDVAPLRSRLVAEGLEVVTQADAIDNVRRLAHNLDLLFAAIAALGGAGYVAATAAASLATVERKRRELSLLRLLGLPTRGLLLFPLAQALYTAGFGLLLAFALYFGASVGLNLLFATDTGERLCRLLPQHASIAVAATLAAVALAALIGGLRATRIEPSEGWREV